MDITASMVKDLRERTGAGMMDCKKALQEAGNFDEAIDWLRKKGLSAAAKKSGRVAAEGLVAVDTSGTRGVVLEVNSETDFVARNDQFQAYVRSIVKPAYTADSIDDLKNMPLSNGKSVEESLTQLIATIGENMTIRRSYVLEVQNGHVVSYMHNQVAENLGKIGILVGLETSASLSEVKEMAEGIAMHIAASNPAALDRDSLDPAIVEKEREILIAQARESGRPEEIIGKMVEGRIRKFYEESVLLDQDYVLDSEKKVRDVLAALSKDLGKPVNITGFLRIELGEGIQKKEDDFAAEVASMAGQ